MAEKQYLCLPPAIHGDTDKNSLNTECDNDGRGGGGGVRVAEKQYLCLPPAIHG